MPIKELSDLLGLLEPETVTKDGDKTPTPKLTGEALASQNSRITNFMNHLAQNLHPPKVEAIIKSGEEDQLSWSVEDETLTELDQLYAKYAQEQDLAGAIAAAKLEAQKIDQPEQTEPVEVSISDIRALLTKNATEESDTPEEAPIIDEAKIKGLMNQLVLQKEAIPVDDKWTISPALRENLKERYESRQTVLSSSSNEHVRYAYLIQHLEGETVANANSVNQKSKLSEEEERLQTKRINGFMAHLMAGSAVAPMDESEWWAIEPDAYQQLKERYEKYAEANNLVAEIVNAKSKAALYDQPPEKMDFWSVARMLEPYTVSGDSAKPATTLTSEMFEAQKSRLGNFMHHLVSTGKAKAPPEETYKWDINPDAHMELKKLYTEYVETQGIANAIALANLEGFTKQAPKDFGKYFKTENWPPKALTEFLDKQQKTFQEIQAKEKDLAEKPETAKFQEEYPQAVQAILEELGYLDYYRIGDDPNRKPEETTRIKEFLFAQNEELAAIKVKHAEDPDALDAAKVAHEKELQQKFGELKASFATPLPEDEETKQEIFQEADDVKLDGVWKHPKLEPLPASLKKRFLPVVEQKSGKLGLGKPKEIITYRGVEGKDKGRDQFTEKGDTLSACAGHGYVADAMVIVALERKATSITISKTASPQFAFEIACEAKLRGLPVKGFTWTQEAEEKYQAWEDKHPDKDYWRKQSSEERSTTRPVEPSQTKPIELSTSEPETPPIPDENTVSREEVEHTPNLKLVGENEEIPKGVIVRADDDAVFIRPELDPTQASDQTPALYKVHPVLLPDTLSDSLKSGVKTSAFTTKTGVAPPEHTKIFDETVKGIKSIPAPEDNPDLAAAIERIKSEAAQKLVKIAGDHKFNTTGLNDAINKLRLETIEECQKARVIDSVSKQKPGWKPTVNNAKNGDKLSHSSGDAEIPGEVVYQSPLGNAYVWLPQSTDPKDPQGTVVVVSPEQQQKMGVSLEPGLSTKGASAGVAVDAKFHEMAACDRIREKNPNMTLAPSIKEATKDMLLENTAGNTKMPGEVVHTTLAGDAYVYLPPSPELVAAKKQPSIVIVSRALQANMGLEKPLERGDSTKGLRAGSAVRGETPEDENKKRHSKSSSVSSGRS